MGSESRGIGLVQVVWILTGLLVAVAAGVHIFHSVHQLWATDVEACTQSGIPMGQT